MVYDIEIIVREAARRTVISGAGAGFLIGLTVSSPVMDAAFAERQAKQPKMKRGIRTVKNFGKKDRLAYKKPI